MNLIVTCPKCGEEMIVSVKQLKWIRCDRCHYGIEILSAKIQATDKDSVKHIGDRHRRFKKRDRWDID